jgi:hypothetical protein
MKPRIEVCVYVPGGREILTRNCYGKEIRWHWEDGTNGLLTPLSGMAFRAIPSSCGLIYQRVNPLKNPEGKSIKKSPIFLNPLGLPWFTTN